MQLKNNIRRFRKSHNMTQQELAYRAGLSLSAIAALEQGERTDPHLSTVQNIARVLQVSILELVHGREVK